LLCNPQIHRIIAPICPNPIGLQFAIPVVGVRGQGVPCNRPPMEFMGRNRGDRTPSLSPLQLQAPSPGKQPRTPPRAIRSHPVVAQTGSCHYISDPILYSSTSSLGTPSAACAQAREMLQQGHGMQCNNTSTTPSGRDMTPIGIIVASFRPMILHAMAQHHLRQPREATTCSPPPPWDLASHV
jgi:hypothetical protein